MGQDRWLIQLVNLPVVFYVLSSVLNLILLLNSLSITAILLCIFLEDIVCLGTRSTYKLYVIAFHDQFYISYFKIQVKYYSLILFYYLLVFFIYTLLKSVALLIWQLSWWKSNSLLKVLINYYFIFTYLYLIGWLYATIHCLKIVFYI